MTTTEKFNNNVERKRQLILMSGYEDEICYRKIRFE